MESMFTTRTPSFAQSGAIFAAIASSTIKVFTLESVSAYSHSGSVAERQMGSLMPPARQMAHCAAFWHGQCPMIALTAKNKTDGTSRQPKPV